MTTGTSIGRYRTAADRIITTGTGLPRHRCLGREIGIIRGGAPSVLRLRLCLTEIEGTLRHLEGPLHISGRGETMEAMSLGEVVRVVALGLIEGEM